MEAKSKRYQQEESVRQYFNQLARDYPDRFSSIHPFHQYFFERRMQLATADLEFSDRTILDIGAGTGALFDFLQKKRTDFHYYACDISAEMLRQSNIPPERYHIGAIDTLNLPIKQFDYIFLLGVTTYLSKAQFLQHLDFITQHLKPEGELIISFTNRAAWDFRFRQFLKYVIPKGLFKTKVISQNFEIKAYTLEEVNQLFLPDFTVTRADYFNFSNTLLNAIAPKWSVRIANRLENWNNKAGRKWLAGDFLIRGEGNSEFNSEIHSTFDIQHSLFNILMFSYYFPPIKSIGTLRNYNIYREFVKYFQGVEVITTSNRHRLQQEVFKQTPAVHEARTFDYRWWLSRKKDRHVHLAEGKKDKRWIRFLQRLFDSFPFNILVGDGGLFYIISAFRQAKRLVREKDIQYLYSSFRPYSDHIPPFLLKIWKPELIWIADFRDLQVDVNVKNTFAERFQHWCNRRILAKADIVTTVSEGLAQHLRRYHPSVYVLRNGIGEATTNTSASILYSKFTIAYTGSMFRKKRNPEPLLAELAQLIQEGLVDPTKIQILYAGKDGALWNSWIAQYQLDSIFKDLGMLSLEKANMLQHSAHINLLLTFSSPEMNGNLTGKLYEYLGSKRPILALVNGSRESELETIIEDLQIGQVVYHQEEKTKSQIRIFILKHYQGWEKNGKLSSVLEEEKLQNYRWEEMMKEFLKYIKPQIPSQTV